MSPNFTLPKAKVYLKKIQTQIQVALLLSSFARHEQQKSKKKEKRKEKREKRERGAVFFAWSFFEFCVLRFASRARSAGVRKAFAFFFSQKLKKLMLLTLWWPAWLILAGHFARCFVVRSIAELAAYQRIQRRMKSEDQCSSAAAEM